jgi:peptide/nickel transport system substrate-binding protein
MPRQSVREGSAGPGRPRTGPRRPQRRHGARLLSGLALLLLVVGCGSPAGPSIGGGAAPEGERVGAPKRVTIAVLGDAQLLYLDVGVSVPGDDAVQELFNTGLTEADPTGVVRAQLAEAVPTLENGLWKTFPDGQMETTWRIIPNVYWHDGAPYTSEDLLFTLAISMDRELPLRQRPAYPAIESAEAPDARTITVRWKKPFIEADTLFSRELALPLPKHLLERAAVEERATFGQLLYWTEEFVGTGPFKLREMARGSHLLLDANREYALGRPKIDEVEVKVLSDPNVLMANLFAGTVDALPGRGLNYDRAAVLEGQWKDGRVETRFSGGIVLHAQFLNQSPAVVAELPFRRALLHAVDRQQLVDDLYAGRGSVAHVFLGPTEPEFRGIEGSLVRYEYDPRRATQLIEGLGYAKGADGFFRDRADQRLALELRVDPGESEQKTAFAVADAWQQLGVGVEPVVTPSQRARDLEYRYTFPALYLRSHSGRIRALLNYHSSQIPLPENRFAAGDNRGRYASSELDASIDRYFLTIPLAERAQVLQVAMRHLTEQLPTLTLFHDASFTVVSNRLENFTTSKAGGAAAKTWDSYLWDVRS